MRVVRPHGDRPPVRWPGDHKGDQERTDLQSGGRRPVRRPRRFKGDLEPPEPPRTTSALPPTLPQEPPRGPQEPPRFLRNHLGNHLRNHLKKGGSQGVMGQLGLPLAEARVVRPRVDRPPAGTLATITARKPSRATFASRGAQRGQFSVRYDVCCAQLTARRPVLHPCAAHKLTAHGFA